jgi:hypothetical protein
MKLNPENPNTFSIMTTVEGRPEIDFDWKAEYVKQRKDRLCDAVHDYLDDADTSILAFYNDLRDIIVEMNTYHKTFAEKAEGALLLVHGKPSAENVEPPAEAWNG